MRHFEARAEVRQAISFIKTRAARHERTFREFQITEDILYVGEALRDFHGVLTGVPTFADDGLALMQRNGEAPTEAAGV